MWTRADLKKEARNVLKSCYWGALIVTVIASVVDNVDKVTSVVFEKMPVIRGKTLAMAALADLNFAELMAIIGVMMLTAFAREPASLRTVNIRMECLSEGVLSCAIDFVRTAKRVVFTLRSLMPFSRISRP